MYLKRKLIILVTCFIIFPNHGEPISDPHPAGQLPKRRPRFSSHRLLPPRLLLHVRSTARSYQGAYKNRSLLVEILVAALASASVGVAIFFLALSVGIYL